MIERNKGLLIENNLAQTKEGIRVWRCESAQDK